MVQVREQTLKSIYMTRGVVGMVVVQLVLLIAVDEVVLADSPLWKKHIVQKSRGTSGQVNTVVANDLDKDGNVDLLGSFDGKVVLYRGPDWDATEILAEMPADQTGRVAQRGCIHSTLMDVDGDGDLDYVGSNRMLFWLECPTKPFVDRWICRTISLDVNGAHCVITGDVDRDGKLDLIANSWRDRGASRVPNSITWLAVPDAPQAAGLWRPNVFANGDAPGGNHYMGFGDVNGDHRPDIACAAKGGPQIAEGEWFAWWEQPSDPDAKWTKRVLSSNEPGASNILPVDVNGDAHIDFVASRGHGRGVLWFKGPEFQKIEIDRNLDTPHSLAIADMDHDGDVDVVACSASLNGAAVWYENNGLGDFQAHVVDQSQSSYDVRLLDMDNDGDTDILVAGHDSENIVWYANPIK
jgi:hypothetical protein